MQGEVWHFYFVLNVNLVLEVVGTKKKNLFSARDPHVLDKAILYRLSQLLNCTSNVLILSYFHTIVFYPLLCK